MSDVQCLLIEAIRNELPEATVTPHPDELGQGWPTVLIDGDNGKLLVSLNPSKLPGSDLLAAHIISAGRASAKLFAQRKGQAGM